MKTSKPGQRLYLIPVLSKALDILELFQAEREPITVEVIHRRTRISKTTVYRVLKTFVHRGYLAQTSDGAYRFVMRPNKLRVGFAGQSAEMPFSQEVSRSLRDTAAGMGVEILELDNCYDAATAVKNAEEFISLGVDLIIEFNVEQAVAPVIGDKIAAAGIPLIAIDIPHPNATFFGLDNYRVGLEAGSALAEYAEAEWGGRADFVLGLDLPEAGPLVQGRITGAFEAIHRALPSVPMDNFERLDGRGMRDRSRKLVTDFLKDHPGKARVLIVAATDTSALGAVDAVRKAGRQKSVAVSGLDCIDEAQRELKDPSSPLIASVSHETTSYGPALLQLAFRLLKGQNVAPYNYVEHQLVKRVAR